MWLYGKNIYIKKESKLDSLILIVLNKTLEPISKIESTIQFYY